MSIEKTNRILDFQKARKQKVDMLVAEKDRQRFAGKRFANKYFHLKESGEWIEHGCSKCKGGMSKRIYDNQLEAGRTIETTICSGCSKREDKKALKELNR